MKLIDGLITRLTVIKRPEKRMTVQFASQLKGKTGIEIGGPSRFFATGGYFPVYQYAATIDGVNYSSETIWEGKIAAGKNYHYKKGYMPGMQYLTEAGELEGIENDKYDFLLSCHSLEHVANPLKALLRWHELLKPGAMLCLILPNKEYCFDRNRPFTTFEHILSDLENDTSEKDQTHFSEIYEKHIIAEDPTIKTLEALKERTADNFNNRCVHHHVFDFDLIKQMLQYCGFKIALQKVIHGINLFTIATKNSN